MDSLMCYHRLPRYCSPSSECRIIVFKQQSSRQRSLFHNNRLRSSSAHQHSVISIHNNTAASVMWQEAGDPKSKLLWWEGGKAALSKTGCKEHKALQPSQGLMSYYFPQTVTKWTVLSAGTQLCWCHFLCTHSEGGSKLSNEGKLEKPAFSLLAVHSVVILYLKIIWEVAGVGSVTYSGLIRLRIGMHKHKAKYSIIQLFLTVTVTVLVCHHTMLQLHSSYNTYWISV